MQSAKLVQKLVLVRALQVSLTHCAWGWGGTDLYPFESYTFPIFFIYPKEWS